MLSAIEELQGFKDLIIAHNLSKHGIEIDFDAEARARFKKIVCESHAGTGEETYYYNDGTPEGLRIVTFKMDWPSFDSPMSGDSIKIGFTHY